MQKIEATPSSSKNMAPKDGKRSHKQYIDALARVQVFSDSMSKNCDNLGDLYKRHLSFAKLYKNHTSLFAAVILHPDYFTDDHGSGLMKPEVYKLIQSFPTLWNDMNDYYKNFMGLGVNLVERQTRQEE